jgi:EF hand
MKTLMMSTTAFLLATGFAFAQSTVGDNAEKPGKGTNVESSAESSGKPKPSADAAMYDTNGDGTISRDEFSAAMGDNAFGKWDTNGDGMLSRDEYKAGVSNQDTPDQFASWDDRYGAWDTDSDNMLSSDEYDQGLWTQYDANSDDMWDQEESAAFGADNFRYDATRSGREVSQ